MPKKPPAPLRPCIFCGSMEKKSKEHIWPEWAHAFLPRSREKRYTRRSYAVPTLEHARPQDVRSMNRQGNVSDIQIRTVCERTCNNGWMSRVETAAKPVLSLLMNGQPAVLGKEEQQMVAAWFAMKIMVAETDAVDALDIVTPQAERGFLMQHKKPPDQWQIWIGHNRGANWQARYAHFLVTLGPEGSEKLHLPDAQLPKNTESSVVGIGQVVAHALHSTYPGFHAQLPKMFAPFLRPIWPFEQAFLWPPGPILNDHAIDALFASFEGTLNAMRVGRVARK